MNISNKIENYINPQNRQIWEEIKTYYNFILTYDPLNKSWASKIEDITAEIITSSNEIDYEAFTHELLHIYLDFLGLSKYPDFIYSIRGENSFGILVVESSLIANLYNFCSHKKMFPYFKAMGFSEYRFVNARIKMYDDEIDFLKHGFLKSRQQALYIHSFIGHCLALMNNVVEEDRNYCENYLLEFKRMDSALFAIIADFDQKWGDSNDLDLLSLFLEFEERLDKWLIKNNLTFENNYCK